MNNDTRFIKILKSVNRFLVFFLLVAFIITCCMTLFLSILSSTLGIEFNSANVGTAAKLTMWNVIFLSLLLSVFDTVRRKVTVDRPVKKIIDASEKIMRGDFTARVEKSQNFNSEDKFNEIAECFNKMAEELSGVETLRTDFISNVSHELKTPLAVINNYGTMLQAPELSEEKRIEYAKSVSDASRRLANLVTNILKLNKLENQQITTSVECFDISEQVVQCLLGFEGEWEKKRLNIETDIEDGVMVKSDREMMSLIWNNLFSNAVKFTEEDGTVSLEIKSENDYAVVKISDTGCGISKEVGMHMFDKFYQGDTSHAVQGNGLGLALVKRVVDILEADISVESELGVGTSFTVKVKKGFA